MYIQNPTGRKLLWLMLVGFFVACHTADNTNAFNKQRLLGNWRDPGRADALFKITPDSIYYSVYERSFPYTLKKDSFIIYFRDREYRARIWASDDTIYTKDAESIVSRLCRIR
jgi:hypothetical protein